MVGSAPRIDPRLVASLVWMDDPRHPIAETNRRLGRLAADLELAKPSYEQVRVIVHALRKARRNTSLAELQIVVMLRVRPPRLSVPRLRIVRTLTRIASCWPWLPRTGRPPVPVGVLVVMLVVAVLLTLLVAWLVNGLPSAPPQTG